ncbi:MAG TPA: GTP-binding protein [Candidatus Angelobacter sp.]|nr:GTP-binding protein [Candidatus Angelobacter sp.]
MTAAIAESLSLSSANLVSQTADLLRFTTAGSVDDGKSTLIGRLLYDTKGVYEDQLVSIQNSGINRSDGPIDLSLITDGLRAEREQGITIDVAYRYFSTPRRKFIIADTPGHEEYTRNMATGASSADAAVILIDASRGVLRQSRRHTCIAALLGIREVVATVNKMDLVDYDEAVFTAIAKEFKDLAARLGIPNVYAIPVSALKGDNIVQPSLHMPWFEGSTLLEYLENVPVRGSDHSRPLRLPVQYVIRPDSHFRGFAGQVASGVLRRGAAVTAFPAGTRSRVKSIVTFDGELESAGPGSSITVTLEDEIDVGRGDLLVAETGLPHSSTNLAAKLVWLHADPCGHEKFYLLKHANRIVRARVSKVLDRLDVNTLDPLPASTPQMNDIAAVHIETSVPIFFDPYGQDRTMGSFILIDAMTNSTVAAGMIDGKVEAARAGTAAAQGRTRLEERMSRNGHPPAALWIVGRPALADKVERQVFEKGWQVEIVSNTEFRPLELNSVVTMLLRIGMVAVFSLTADDLDLRQAITAIYGDQSFLSTDQLAASDQEACAQVMRWLDEVQKGFAGQGKRP